MSDGPSVLCAQCGRQIQAATNQPVEERQACPACGSMARNIRVAAFDAVETHDSLQIKLRRSGSRKVVQRQRVGDSLTKRDGVWRKEALVIDTEADHYLHEIRDPDGTVVYRDESKLTDHRGHGSAKKPA